MINGTLPLLLEPLNGSVGLAKRVRFHAEVQEINAQHEYLIVLFDRGRREQRNPIVQQAYTWFDFIKQLINFVIRHVVVTLP
jgi:hypothetical protein